MSEQHHPEEQHLSTADVAAAAEPRQPEAGARPPTGATERPAETASAERPAGRAAPERAPLFSGDETGRFRARWEDIQTGFVDNPRQSVQQADQLVAEVIKRLAEVFADERERLEQQWSKGENVSTEDLRVALQRYRSFFDRLLSL